MHARINSDWASIKGQPDSIYMKRKGLAMQHLKQAKLKNYLLQNVCIVMFKFEINDTSWNTYNYTNSQKFKKAYRDNKDILPCPIIPLLH